MARTVAYSDYGAADADEALYELKGQHPGHEFRVKKVTVEMFDEEFTVVGILDATEDEITLLI